MKLETKKDIRDTIIRPHVQNLVDVGWRKGVCARRAFSVIWVLSFFALTSRSHQKTDHDHLWLKMRVSAH